MDKVKNLTLIAIACIVSFSVVVSSYLVIDGIRDIKSGNDTLTITGSAKKTITSDQIVWTASFSTDSPDLQSGYAKLKSDSELVKEYLLGQGVKEDELAFSAINTMARNKILENGVYTNEIESYNLYQTLEVRSPRVLEIAEISRTSSDLIESGVNFTSNQPQYFYTKLADLKVEMIGLATEDSKERAEKLLAVTDNKVGKLKAAKVGVFQITQLYSNEVTDYGINDTYSYEKEITAVVTCEFEVK